MQHQRPLRAGRRWRPGAGAAKDFDEPDLGYGRLNDEWQATDRRYLSEDSMILLYPERDKLATAELTAGN